MFKFNSLWNIFLLIFESRHKYDKSFLFDLQLTSDLVNRVLAGNQPFFPDLTTIDVITLTRTSKNTFGPVTDFFETGARPQIRLNSNNTEISMHADSLWTLATSNS